MKLKLAILIVGNLLFVLSTSFAAAPTIDVPYGTSPVFSGSFDTTQWKDAYMDTFMLETKTKYSAIDTFFVKYNSDTLYLIWVTPDYEPQEIARHSLLFDTSFDGGAVLWGDDRRLMADTVVEFKEFSGNTSLWEEEKVDGWDCQYSKNVCFVTQFAVPFSKIGIVPGANDTIGFALLADSDTRMGRWPDGSDSIQPATWGILTSSGNWVTPAIPVIDVPYGTVPAFTGTFDTTQWADAYMDTFRLETKTKYSAIDTFFVKYNNDSLYFIWVTPDYEPQEIARHSLIFDTKLDRSSGLLGDDYRLMADTTVEFTEYNGGSGFWEKDKVAEWDCQYSKNVCFVTQFSVSLNKLGITKGENDSIGFALLADSDTRMGRWPTLMDSVRPVTWGVLTSSNKWETPMTIIDVPCGTAPVFDGSLDSTQWMDAYQAAFNFPGKSAKAPAADSFWVKYNGDTLYVMVITPDFETIGIKDHSLLLDLKYNKDAVLMDYDFRLMGDFLTASPYEFYGNTTVWEPAALSSWVLGLSDKTDLITQFAVPIANLNINIGQQDTIGFAVMAAGDVYGAWPYGCDSISPVTWGALTSSAGWTGVMGKPDDQSKAKPFSLSNVYPNPVKNRAEFRYQLSQPLPAKLSVYNIAGQLVKSFGQGVQIPGTHTINWNVQSLPSGVYLYRLEAGSYKATKRMLVIK
ncbi:T9SS type A sorting domain-containing protein [candidate division TA06 bacterium]|nr:T9SS type A sorting domain-containing protein [candidate division TA06 bacterium]